VLTEPATDSPDPTDDASTPRTFGFDVVLTTGGKVLFVVCGALLTVLIARTLGPSGQGTFAVAYSLTLLLVQIGSIGLPIANPYFVARDPTARRAVVVHSLWIAVVVAAALTAAVVAIKAVEPDVLRGLSWTETAITLAALPAALATVYLQGVTLGQQRMVWYSLVEISQVGPSLVVLAVSIAVADPDLVDVLLIVAAGRYLSLLVAAYAVRGAFRDPATPRPGLVRQMLGHAARVYLVALLSFALIRLDLLIVNGLLGAEDAGQYSIAAFVTEALIVVPSVISTNLIPRIAKTDDTEVTALVLRVVTVVWGVICVVSVPVAVVGVPLAFGHGYDEAVTLYAWLAPGTFFLGMLSALMAHYWTRGYPPVLVGAWVAGVAVNVAGNVLLLPSLGVTVAPIMSSVTYAGVLMAHMLVFAREAGSWHALAPEPRETIRLMRAAFTGEAP
jgi:O-antigen/teichoic acid export membrane protein